MAKRVSGMDGPDLLLSFSPGKSYTVIDYHEEGPVIEDDIGRRLILDEMPFNPARTVNMTTGDALWFKPEPPYRHVEIEPELLSDAQLRAWTNES